MKIKLSLFWLVLCSIITPAVCTGDWVMNYYLNPNPEELIEQIEALREKGIFEKENAQWPLVSFLSQLMANNPEKIEEWMFFSETLDDSAIDAIRLAAWYSRTTEAKEYFEKKGLSNYSENKAPDILKLEVDNPTVLDMLWGYFFATGELEPLKRISIALELSKYTDAIDSYKDSEKTEEDKKNLYFGATFKSAMWSIESNCRNHPLVLKHFRTIFYDNETPKSQGLWIGVILSKVVPEEVSISFGNEKENQSREDNSYIDQKPLDFPYTTGTFTIKTLEEIERVSNKLNSKIGSYPPRFKNERDRKKTYKIWSEAILSAERLRKEEQDSERILCLLSNLYRQGHNMEVRECGQKTEDILNTALKIYPESVPIHFQASYAYLQFSPRYAPKGEQSLLKLRELLNTNRNKKVEEGLLFAYLAQKRNEDAYKQAKHCLTIDPGNQFFQQVEEALKDGGQIEEKRM